MLLYYMRTRMPESCRELNGNRILTDRLHSSVFLGECAHARDTTAILYRYIKDDNFLLAFFFTD